MKNYKFIFLTVISLIIMITLTLSYYITSSKPKTTFTKNEDITIKVKNKILDEAISEDFLNWISKTYGTNALIKLDKYLETEEYQSSIWHDLTGFSYYALLDLYENNNDNFKIIDNDKNEATLSFVGDVSLADNWYIVPKYDERGKGITGILSQEIVDIMTNSTIMVANNEFTISDRGEPLPGKLYTFRASPNRIPIYDEMGVDLVTLANNHVYDYGELAFNDMIDSLNNYHIPYIGAGKNIEEAKRPYYFIVNGYKIAFVNATRAEKNIMTPSATENRGGVFRCYDPTDMINLITKTKTNSDYVIALIHFGKEDSHELEKEQIDSSKKYIDAGADTVIGSHAHVLQGIEFYKDKPIIYNLGDFIFNNEIKDTGIFQIKLSKNGFIEYYFIPAEQKDEFTKLPSESDKIRIINNMNNWSINATIDKDGKITKKAN